MLCTSVNADGLVFLSSARLSAFIQRVHELGASCEGKDGEVFLPTLLSNAFHALDAVFFGSRVRSGLAVRIHAFPASKSSGASAEGGGARLCIADNGVGMTRGDLINNLASVSRAKDPEVR